MIRLSHFAAPAVLGAAVLFGAQGCAHEHPDTVPAGAAELSAGTQDISATAPHDGTFYVYDITANKPLYVGTANRGDTIRVDAKQNEMFLNDKLITKRDDLRDSDRYKIFFDQTEMEREREQAYDRARQAGSTTIVQPTPANPNTTVVVPQQQPAPSGTSVQVQPAPSGTPVQVQPAPSGTSVQVHPAPQSSGGTSVQVQPATPPAGNNQGTTVVVPPPAPAR